jgi:hypothetical protein
VIAAASLYEGEAIFSAPRCCEVIGGGWQLALAGGCLQETRRGAYCLRLASSAQADGASYGSRQRGCLVQLFSNQLF